MNDSRKQTTKKLLKDETCGTCIHMYFDNALNCNENDVLNKTCKNYSPVRKDIVEITEEILKEVF